MGVTKVKLSGLTNEQKEKIGSDIDNEGLGYWVQHYGDFEGNDDELKSLIDKAREAMDNLEDYLNFNDIMF